MDKTRQERLPVGPFLPSHYYPLRSSMMAYYGIFLTILDNIILGGDDHILINSDQIVFVELDSCFLNQSICQLGQNEKPCW